MLKQTILLFLVLISLNASAQQGTASPYSFYGIGELNFKGTVENQSMGGISMYNDSIHLNLLNPASLGKLKLTTFSVGATQKIATLKTSESSENTSSSTFDYLAIGLPMGKLSMSFGLVPFTSVGYKTGFTNYQNANAGDGQFEGSGGVNKVFVAAGYSITNNLSLGVDLNYNFGKITKEAIVITQSGIQGGYNNQEINEARLSGLAVKFGASYNKIINNKLELMTGITYSPEINLNSVNDERISTFKYNSNGVPVIRDTQEYDTENTDFKIPAKITIGVGIGKPKKWFAGLDYTNLGASSLENINFSNTNVTFNDANKISLGGFYIPKYNALTNYLSRVVFRTGFRYENTGMKIQNEDINEFGISFGVGLPIGRKFSNINIGVEYGSTGTTKSNLVKEDFFNINLSLSFNDKWFQKRKID